MNMLFTNTKGYKNTYTNNDVRSVDITLLSNIHYNKPVYRSSSSPSAVISISNNNIPVQKSMKWGEPIWFFFHTIAEKLKPDSFNIVKADLLNIIYTICSNLPCPYCTSHATAILKKSNFHQITDLFVLRTFIWQFHNKVNERLKKTTMDYSSHLEKYNKMKLVDVINLFIKIYNENSGVTMMLYNFHKKQLIQQLRKYFNDNAYLYILN